jgi:F-type H+-transporting ATPase subunit epsilon
MPLTLQIVTAEKVVYDEQVDIVVAPGELGEMGILPQHAPLLSTLKAGELRYRRSGSEESLAIGGGFVEVLNNRVIVLADSAERVEEIDVSRAEQARQRAEERLRNRNNLSDDEVMALESSLRRAMARIEVVRRNRGGRGGSPSMQ